MDSRAGKILAGKYRCEHELGRGGTGDVIAATHLALGRRVALKILAADASPDAARRFVREARLAARLRSDHVARILDAGEVEGGVPYIAMELLDGRAFDAILRERGALPVAEACSYVLQACEGIAEAHSLGMVHRDIKLANLFLAKDASGAAVVKVLDFGISKADPMSTASAVQATQTGALLGTPRTMAPEQVMSAKDVDARTDVWALGVVLYTMLTARPPFEGDSIRALFAAILDEPMRPIDRPLPKGLLLVIERCLRKKREERYPSVAELAADLAPFVSNAGAKRARYVALAVALLSAAVGASIVGAQSRHARRIEARAPALSVSPAPVSLVPVASSVTKDIAALSPSSSSSSSTSSSAPAAPATAPTRTSTSAPTQTRDLYARRLPKAQWSAEFVDGYGARLCDLSFVARCYYGVTRPECDRIATTATRACADGLEPTMPAVMEDREVVGAFASKISHCAVPDFKKRMAAAGFKRDCDE